MNSVPEILYYFAGIFLYLAVFRLDAVLMEILNPNYILRIVYYLLWLCIGIAMMISLNINAHSSNHSYPQ